MSSLDPELQQRPPSRLPSNVRDHLEGSPLLEEEMQANYTLEHSSKPHTGKRATWTQVTLALLSLQLG
jgi:hypothetical protein